MARGPKKHLKRLNAPKHWMLDKLGGIWAPRPSTGPHKMRECLPMSLVLRQRLKYALTRRETQMICMRRLVAVDGKTRTDLNYPTGFMDVISIERTNENFRVLYDVKGRFKLEKISKEEAGFKLCRVIKISKAKKATIGTNREMNGQARSVPYVVTHDGRTIKYPHPDVKTNDTVKLNLKTGKIEEFAKFQVGSLCMATKGKNQGRVGTVAHIEKHPGSYDIVHVTDIKGNSFATRLENVFIIGEKKPMCKLPKARGVKLDIFEEREKYFAKGKTSA